MVDIINSQRELWVVSPNFAIFVQGSWGAWNNPNNLAASDFLYKEKVVSSLLYDSRRDATKTRKASTYLDWVNAFDGKTYSDELDELRQRVDYIRKIEMPRRPENIFISANSYGAGLAALVSGDRIPELQRLLLFSPQIICPEGAEDVNIYKNFPPLEEFLGAISRYKGELTIVQATKDPIVRMGHSAMLYEAARIQDSRDWFC